MTGSVRARLLPVALLGATATVLAIGAVGPVATASTSHPNAASRSGLNAQIFSLTVAPASTDAWAIISNFRPAPNAVDDGVIRLHNGHWSKVALKHIPASTTLRSIAAGSSKSIWLAGSVYVDADSHYLPVLAESTGGAFKRVPFPAVPIGQILAIGASSAKNAWLVATDDNTANFVFHWNGHKWKNAHVPMTSIGNFGRASISTTGAKNVWLVGTGGDSTAQHWDGQSWTELPLVSGDTAQGITTTGTHAWIAGYISRSPAAPLALRLHASTWKKMSIPASTLPGVFDGVSAVGSTAYAVGHRNTDAMNNAVPIIYRLHGKSASFVPSVAVPKYSTLHAAAASSQLAIAGGAFETKGYCSSPFHPLAEALGASSWKRLKIPATVAPAGKSGSVACG